MSHLLSQKNTLDTLIHIPTSANSLSVWHAHCTIPLAALVVSIQQNSLPKEAADNSLMWSRLAPTKTVFFPDREPPPKKDGSLFLLSTPFAKLFDIALRFLYHLFLPWVESHWNCQVTDGLIRTHDASSTSLPELTFEKVLNCP